MTANSIEQLTQTVQDLTQRVAVLEAKRTQKTNGLDMNPQAVWTPYHISKYSGFSYGYVTQHLIKAVDFPKSIERETGTKRQRRLYKAGDIIQYFNQRKTS